MKLLRLAWGWLLSTVTRGLAREFTPEPVDCIEDTTNEAPLIAEAPPVVPDVHETHVTVTVTDKR